MSLKEDIDIKTEKLIVPGRAEISVNLEINCGGSFELDFLLPLVWGSIWTESLL